MQDWLQGGLKISPAMISWPYWRNRCSPFINSSHRPTCPRIRQPWSGESTADRQIDALIYELYGLTEEIGIVEGGARG